MRGQTTLDFTIGISVFIAVIVFVFAFIPGILTPFTAVNEDQTVAVGAVADDLSLGRLGSPSEPYVLDAACTVAFFGNTAGCGFSPGPMEEQLGVGPGTSVNVSLFGNLTNDGVDEHADPLCWNEGATDGEGELRELDEVGSCDVPLVRGGTPPPDNDATIAARRVVTLGGEGVTLKVVMW